MTTMPNPRVRTQAPHARSAQRVISTSARSRARDSHRPAGTEPSRIRCYGFRYDHAFVALWLSRDPIAEQGGVNLYGFVRNDSIQGIDRFGLELVTFTYATFIESSTAETPTGRLFAGDNKSVFSNSGHFRTYHLVVVDTDKQEIVSEIKEIGETLELDPLTKAVIARATASTSKLHATVSKGTPGNSCYFTLTMTGNASDPLVWYAPAIDYSVTVGFDTKNGALYWGLNHDPFPAHQFGIDDDWVHTFSAVGRSPVSLLPVVPKVLAEGKRTLEKSQCCK